MSGRGGLVLLLLALLAVLSWYAGPQDDAPTSNSADDTQARSGYYMLDAEILGTDETGAARYLIRAAEATQPELGEPIALAAVTLDYAGDADTRWSISADAATLSQTDDSLTFAGNVKATWDDGAGDGRLTMRTDALAFDTAARVVETDDVVRFDMALGSLVATGMRVALDEDKVELRSNIRGQFIP